MNSLFKIGVAGALALGGSVAANAAITVGTTSNATGNVVLFADVFNSSGSLVQSYAGDTGIAVTSVGGGTQPSTFTDSNLNTLLSAASGNTLLWALEGGGGINGGTELISSGTSNAIGIVNQSGATLDQMIFGLNADIKNLNGNLGSATSGLYGSSTAAAGQGGSGFNPSNLGADAANWFGGTGEIATKGLNTQSALYLLTSTTQDSSSSGAQSTLFNVALTSSGLVFSQSGSVPLPGAVWLLGSGLLGLAGVARRKAGFASFV